MKTNKIAIVLFRTVIFLSVFVSIAAAIFGNYFVAAMTSTAVLFGVEFVKSFASVVEDEEALKEVSRLGF